MTPPDPDATPDAAPVAAADAAPEAAPGLVRSVDRALEVLELVAARGELGVSEIADELGVHRSTVSRLAGVLTAHGLLAAEGQRGRLVLGTGVLRLAAAASGRLDITRLAAPVCRRLASTVDETVNLTVADGDMGINLLQEYGSSSIALQNWVGRRTPLHATATGKVLLAHMAPDGQRLVLSSALVRYTDATVLERTALRGELARIAEEGHARSYEEYEVGLHAVAAPVRDHSGAVVAALAVSGPAYRLTRRRARAVVGTLTAAAAELSTAMGHIDHRPGPPGGGV